MYMHELRDGKEQIFKYVIIGLGKVWLFGRKGGEG
jgi:hypothetical protein